MTVMTPGAATPLGVHVSIAGGVDKAIARAAHLGCTAMQIFTANASRWQAKELPGESVEKYRAARAESPIEYVAAHDSYLINFASPDPLLRQKSIAAFCAEMERCRRLGITDLVMHPGAHMGRGVDAGLATVAESLRTVLTQAPPAVRILIENTAGQGTSLGAAFEELAELIRLVPEGRFGICFDTCHAFAAGYDISSYNGYMQVMETFDRLVGTERIALFHLNDSKKALGSRVDRHDHVGRGHIGVAGFRALMRDRRFLCVPKIIETPGGRDGRDHLDTLALLRTLEKPEESGGLRCGP